MPRRPLVLSIALAVAFVSPRVAAQATATLYEGALLVHGEDAAPIPDSAFLVVDGSVQRVGRRGSIVAAHGASRVDLSGKTVIPALISTHVHPGFQSGLSYGRENYTRATYLRDLERAAYVGVRAVLSQGIDPGDLAYGIRAEQQAGRLGGTSLLVAGRGIGAPNAGPGAAAYQGIAYEVSTPEQGRMAVGALAARKVDIIKIWVDDRAGRAPRMPPSVFGAIITEAHQRGLRVNAHVFYHDDAVALVDAGVDALAHLVRDREMDDSLIAAIVKRGVYVMPNLGGTERGTHAEVPGWFVEPGFAALLREAVPAAVRARMRASFTERDPGAAAAARERYGLLQRSLAKLHQAGARIILGSDTGLEDHPFGLAEQRELEAMAAAGMPAADVIVAATSRSAEYLRLRNRGRVAAGVRADFIVLAASPLDDIRHTRRIEQVYFDGAALDRTAMRARLSQ